jgi:ATP-dependent DNA helicase RecQ
MPSTVVFTLTKEDLYQFEKSNPEFDPIIKGLLRSYEGIFDYPAAISEKSLANFLRMDETALIHGLKKLQGYGVIEYAPQKDKPQIHFLQNRINVGDLYFNTANLNKRKMAFEKRIEAMISYVKKMSACRSKIIGNYFNDMSIQACGICDNCINEKNLSISKDEFDKITKEIYKLLQKSSLPAAELVPQLKMFEKSKVWKVINYLQSENKIRLDKNGLIVK